MSHSGSDVGLLIFSSINLCKEVVFSHLSSKNVLMIQVLLKRTSQYKTSHHTRLFFFPGVCHSHSTKEFSVHDVFII